MRKPSPVKGYLAGLALGMCGSATTYANEAQDPWEGFNRKIFVFNDTLDAWLLKPVSKGYRFVAPEFVEIGVSNFFDNLLEITYIFNDLLQGKFAAAGNDTGRFLINTTLGVAGFFDVARHMGLPENQGEDFGQTLAVWGVGAGPYVMLPLVGPRTLRDAFALPINSALNPVGYIEHTPTRNTLYTADGIDTRASLLDFESLISGDKYTYLRDAYLQRREFLINDGVVEDSFESDMDF